MDLIWPLESSYKYSEEQNVWRVIAKTKPHRFYTYDTGTLHIVRYKSGGVGVHGLWPGVTEPYRAEHREDLVYMLFADERVDIFSYSNKEMDRAHALMMCWDSVAIGAPTDPTALAIIAAVDALPQPIAEEIVPHLVMSLSTLRAQ